MSNKIITKLLVLRLAPLLPRIISPTQSAFVLGRVIHDNVLLVQVLVHDLNRHTWGNNVVLKLDMAKAYDKMSWSFIIKMLRSFGFSEQWVSLIRRAIFGPWFSVLFNAVSHGFFQSQCEFRQGDPLSLSLFIVTAEFLSRGLDCLYAHLPSVRYSTITPVHISHLSFADDIVIFTNGSRSSLRRLMDSSIIMRQFLDSRLVRPRVVFIWGDRPPPHASLLCILSLVFSIDDSPSLILGAWFSQEASR